MPRNLYSKKQGVVHHEFILGKSGTGKAELTLSKLAQQTRRGGGGYIETKPEARTEAILSTMASLHGRPLDLHIIDLHNPASGHFYSPISSGKNTTQAVSTVVNLFGDGLEVALFHWVPQCEGVPRGTAEQYDFVDPPKNSRDPGWRREVLFPWPPPWPRYSCSARQNRTHPLRS